jgi:hypothetical protein
MPAPTPAVLELALTNAYLSQGFVQQVVDPVSGNLVPSVPPVLPAALQKQVQAIAQALALVWATWETDTVVSIPETSPEGSPSVGVLI